MPSPACHAKVSKIKSEEESESDEDLESKITKG